MREFKFRAYDKETKEMSYDFLSKNWLKVCIESPYVELMQYTGLKDKNGTEIYEGDIIDGSWINPMSKEKVMRHYQVTFTKGKYDAQLIGHHPYGTTMLYFENDKSEVIGNIYENPELLEVNHE